MDPSQYMKMTGMTPQALQAQMRPEAERRLKTRFALEAVAEAEGITPTDEEVDEDIKKSADMYNTDFEEYKKTLTEKQIDEIKKDLSVKKAAEFVRDNSEEADEETKGE